MDAPVPLVVDTPPFLFSLNDDVLEEILSYFYGYGALSVALTCKLAHSLAIPRVRVRACCKSPQMLRRICEYMTRPHGPDSAIDRSQPARHLRQLEIRTRAFRFLGADHPHRLRGGHLERDDRGLHAYDTAPLLSQVLERAVRIRKLELGPFDQFLTDREDIRRALKGLHHLTHLHFDKVGNTTLALLQDVCKGLQSLTL
ncbi:hypothetical protein BD413DRAFT_476381, partial [Trametes elegans]